MTDNAGYRPTDDSALRWEDDHCTKCGERDNVCKCARTSNHKSRDPQGRAVNDKGIAFADVLAAARRGEELDPIDVLEAQSWRIDNQSREIASLRKQLLTARSRDETTELHRLRTELLEVNKALGLGRDNQDNALRVKTALRLRLPVEPEAPKRDCVHSIHVDYCPSCQDDLKRLRSSEESKAFREPQPDDFITCGYRDYPAYKIAHDRWKYLTAVKASGEQILRHGKCEKCEKTWVVKGDPTAVVSVLAVHCTCGHINK